MKALFILVGLLSTGIALLCAGGLSPAQEQALAAGSACGFAIIREAAELEKE